MPDEKKGGWTVNEGGLNAPNTTMPSWVGKPAPTKTQVADAPNTFASTQFKVDIEGEKAVITVRDTGYDTKVYGSIKIVRDGEGRDTKLRHFIPGHIEYDTKSLTGAANPARPVIHMPIKQLPQNEPLILKQQPDHYQLNYQHDAWLKENIGSSNHHQPINLARIAAAQGLVYLGYDSNTKPSGNDPSKDLKKPNDELIGTEMYGFGKPGTQTAYVMHFRSDNHKLFSVEVIDGARREYFTPQELNVGELNLNQQKSADLVKAMKNAEMAMAMRGGFSRGSEATATEEIGQLKPKSTSVDIPRSDGKTPQP
jgi:hypothetical protein